MTREHHIDQSGKVVYTVNDEGSNCGKCVYRPPVTAVPDIRECAARVPAEHITPYTLKCVEDNLIYKEPA